MLDIKEDYLRTMGGVCQIVKISDKLHGILSAGFSFVATLSPASTVIGERVSDF